VVIVYVYEARTDANEQDALGQLNGAVERQLDILIDNLLGSVGKGGLGAIFPEFLADFRGFPTEPYHEY